MITINIEELLKSNKKSKNQLSKETGISRTNINKIIKGETTSISFNTIELLCEYLNCTPGELITIEKKIN